MSRRDGGVTRLSALHRPGWEYRKNTALIDLDKRLAECENYRQEHCHPSQQFQHRADASKVNPEGEKVTCPDGVGRDSALSASRMGTLFRGPGISSRIGSEQRRIGESKHDTSGGASEVQPGVSTSSRGVEALAINTTHKCKEDVIEGTPTFSSHRNSIEVHNHVRRVDGMHANGATRHERFKSTQCSGNVDGGNIGETREGGGRVWSGDAGAVPFVMRRPQGPPPAQRSNIMQTANGAAGSTWEYSKNSALLKMERANVSLQYQIADFDLERQKHAARIEEVRVEARVAARAEVAAEVAEQEARGDALKALVLQRAETAVWASHKRDILGALREHARLRRRERPLQAAALRWFARTLSKVLFEWGRLAFHRQRRLRLARVFRRRCLPRRRRATLLQVFHSWHSHMSLKRAALRLARRKHLPTQAGVLRAWREWSWHFKGLAARLARYHRHIHGVRVRVALDGWRSVLDAQVDVVIQLSRTRAAATARRTLRQWSLASNHSQWRATVVRKSLGRAAAACTLGCAREWRRVARASSAVVALNQCLQKRHQMAELTAWLRVARRRKAVRATHDNVVNTINNKYKRGALSQMRRWTCFRVLANRMRTTTRDRHMRGLLRSWARSARKRAVLVARSARLGSRRAADLQAACLLQWLAHTRCKNQERASAALAHLRTDLNELRQKYDGLEAAYTAAESRLSEAKHHCWELTEAVKRADMRAPPSSGQSSMLDTPLQWTPVSRCEGTEGACAPAPRAAHSGVIIQRALHTSMPAQPAIGLDSEPLPQPPSITSPMTVQEASLVVFGGFDGARWFGDVHVGRLTSRMTGPEPASASQSLEDVGRWRISWRAARSVTYNQKASAHPRPKTFPNTEAGDGGSERDWWRLIDADELEPFEMTERRDHVACTLPDNRVLVTGGFDGNAELDDTLILCIVDGDSSGSNDTLAVWAEPACRKGRLPSPRSHHAVCVRPPADSNLSGREDPGECFLFGGYTSHTGPLNDLLVFNLDTLEWQEAVVFGDVPAPRRSHAMALQAGKLWVHGGTNGARHFDDLFQFDLASKCWARVTRTAGAAPTARRSHSLIAVDHRHLVLFGGYDGANFLNDCFILNTTTLVWTEWTPKGKLPIPRSMHSLASFNHAMVLFGGVHKGQALDDVHVLQNEALQEGMHVRCLQSQISLQLQHSREECHTALSQLTAANAELAAVRQAASEVEDVVKHYARKAAETVQANKDLTTKLRIERERTHLEAERADGCTGTIDQLAAELATTRKRCSKLQAQLDSSYHDSTKISQRHARKQGAAAEHIHALAMAEQQAREACAAMEREVERLEVALEEATVGMEKLSVSERAQREGKQMAQEALRDVQKTAALATAEAAAVVAQATVAQVRTEFASLLPNAPWHADNQRQDLGAGETQERASLESVGEVSDAASACGVVVDHPDNQLAGTAAAAAHNAAAELRLYGSKVQELERSKLALEVELEEVKGALQRQQEMRRQAESLRDDAIVHARSMEQKALEEVRKAAEAHSIPGTDATHLDSPALRWNREAAEVSREVQFRYAANNPCDSLEEELEDDAFEARLRSILEQNTQVHNGS